MVNVPTSDDVKYKVLNKLYAAMVGASASDVLTRDNVPTKDELVASGWKLVWV